MRQPRRGQAPHAASVPAEFPATVPVEEPIRAVVNNAGRQAASSAPGPSTLALTALARLAAGCLRRKVSRWGLGPAKWACSSAALNRLAPPAGLRTGRPARPAPGQRLHAACALWQPGNQCQPPLARQVGQCLGADVPLAATAHQARHRWSPTAPRGGPGGPAPARRWRAMQPARWRATALVAQVQAPA